LKLYIKARILVFSRNLTLVQNCLALNHSWKNYRYSPDFLNWFP